MDVTKSFAEVDCAICFGTTQVSDLLASFTNELIAGDISEHLKEMEVE